MIVKRGRTSQIVPIRILDTTSVVGAGKTGLVYTSTNLTCYYHRELAASATQLTLADMTLGTWVSGGFKQVDATHLPGQYSLGLPDAAISASDASTWVEIMVYDSGSALGIPQTVLRIDLVAVDLQDATRLGLSALPNAAAGANTGLPMLDSNLRVSANVTAVANGVIAAASFAANALDAVWSTAARTLTAFSFSVTVSDIAAAALARFFTQDSGKTYADAVAGSVVKEIVTNVAISTSAIADAVWNRLTSAITTVGSIGKLIKDFLDVAVSSRLSPAQVVTPPLAPTNDRTIEAGDDYLVADGLALQWSISGYPSFTGATVVMRSRSVVYSGSGSGQILTMPLTRVQSLAMLPGGARDFEIEVTYPSGSVVTPVRASLLAVKKIT